MKDPNPRMRIQAIRASETLYKAGDQSFADDYRALTKDPNTDVVIQAMLTLNTLKVADAPAVLRATLDANKARGVQLVANAILNPSANVGRGGGGRGGAPPFTTEQQAVMQRGDTIYKELCFSCHGDDGRGAPQPGAASGVADGAVAGRLAARAGASRLRDQDAAARSDGPLDGKRYGAGVMVPMGTNPDEWIASSRSYVRNSFGNRASFVTAADVARVRAATAARKTMWTLDGAGGVGAHGPGAAAGRGR